MSRLRLEQEVLKKMRLQYLNLNTLIRKKEFHQLRKQ